MQTAVEVPCQAGGDGRLGGAMSISLVTGGSGFIGQHLVDQLLAKGDRVRILDIEPPSARRAGVSFIQGSVTDRHVVEEAVSGVRHIYHTAAIPYLWAPDPVAFHEINVVGTEIVIKAALRGGVERVVHTSSATVLTSRHAHHGSAILDETRHTREQDLFGHYARSKWRAETLVLSYRDRLSVVVVMPTLPLGPGDRHLTPPTRMLLDFVNGRNPVFADCLLNIIDVRDVAAGHLFACERGRSGQRYILNQHGVAMAAFLQHLEEITGHTMPRWRIPKLAALVASAAAEAWSDLVTKQAPRAPLAGTRMSLLPLAFDSQLARTELGLPATPLVETLSDAVAWLAEAGHLSGTIEKPALAFGDHHGL